ncbi:MAG: hypothetical protein ACTSR8_12405 [Promethearchaeota archaeon]
MEIEIITYMILLALLTLVGIFIIVVRTTTKEPDAKLYALCVLFVILLIIFPFFDLLIMQGFLAAILLETSVPSIYGAICIALCGNLSIYGIHIFGSSVNLLHGERYKEEVIYGGQFTKRRFPIFSSFHIIGLAYQTAMGSLTGILIISVVMVFLNLEANHIQKKRLVSPKKEAYEIYMRKVPKKIYSIDVMVLIIIMYAAVSIGLLGILLTGGTIIKPI